jgi:hypothetical protein
MNFGLKIDIFLLLTPMTSDIQRLLHRLTPGSGGGRERGKISIAAEHAANLLLVVLTLLAVASLVAEYGFSLTPEWSAFANTATQIVLYGFLFQTSLRMLFAGERLHYIRTHRIELFIGSSIVLHLALRRPRHG